MIYVGVQLLLYTPTVLLFLKLVSTCQGETDSMRFVVEPVP